MCDPVGVDTRDFVSQNDEHEDQSSRHPQAGQATEDGGLSVLQEDVQHPRTAHSSSPVPEEAEVRRRRSC